MKLQINTTSENLLTTMSDFLVSHYQRVDLNDQTAKLSPVNAEVHRVLVFNHC